jgi:hypothetical protein
MPELDVSKSGESVGRNLPTDIHFLDPVWLPGVSRGISGGGGGPASSASSANYSGEGTICSSLQSLSLSKGYPSSPSSSNSGFVKMFDISCGARLLSRLELATFQG